ncbi:MAG: S-adenosyl-methyltransferase MraW [Candidatus Midichloriaceae bacterium]|jgi:16S rRNA (cytosine1402-N4)-methyltransferase|nr:S-adenosyl-methyltransferase MraW [Candidatus Midichloriaceae bacterium]
MQPIDTPHIPVLIEEVLDFLNPDKGGLYVDCTFGAGGYSRRILEAGANKLIAIDRDVNVAATAEKFAQEYGNKFEFHNIANDKIGIALEGLSGTIDGIVYDIGVSSMQIDTPERGFSFQVDGPLDMRMDQRDNLSAYDVVNTYTQGELARIIYEYGDEQRSRSIAKQIVDARHEKPIETTLELVRIIQKAVGHYRDDINPATRTFQAIRIEVNKELDQLKASLHAAKSLLKVGGKIVVVSFHSGEDKIVKSLFNEWCGKKVNVNKYLPDKNLNSAPPQFKFLQKGIVIAEDNEIKTNPRARSARLRAIEKLI